MTHLVPVKEYTDAAVMLAEAAERRARLYAPAPKKTAPTPRPAPVRRDNIECRYEPWSKEDDATLCSMRDNHASLKEIATALCRTQSSILDRARLLAPRMPDFTEPTAEKARIAYEAAQIDLLPRHMRVQEIIKLVAQLTGTTPAAITSGWRTAPIASARQLAMWLAADRLDRSFSYPVLGRAFGRDHTTVLHAVRRFNRVFGENARGAGIRSKRKRDWLLAKEREQ